MELFSRSTVIFLFSLSLTACDSIDQNTLNRGVQLLEAATSKSTPLTGVDQFSVADQIGSLKQALSQGAESSVGGLAQTNGFLGNPKVRIPLPENLLEAEAKLRKFGLGKYADELNTSMNRAAEAAVPEAKALLLNAVANMTVTDAKNILLGKDDAATQYFRSNTESALTAKFKPIVAYSMQKVTLAQAYNRFATAGAKLGLVKQSDSSLEDYITSRAMNGLFLMVAEKEKEIRANPLQATGDLAKKVFAELLHK
jgi:hypothetical protein